MKIKDIIPNPNNPRIIKDDKFAKLVQSIKEFSEMLELRPIVIDEDNMVLGGNMRLKACIEAGLTDVPVKVAKLTEEQKKEFIIKDNVGFGEWDWDILSNEWEVEQLEEWGLSVPINLTEEQKDLSENIETNFRIEVILKDEKSQELLYNELIERSYECRLLTL